MGKGSSAVKDLVDVFPVQLSLDEGDSGKVLIRGPFGHCAQPTSNGRLYPQKIMEREFRNLREVMAKRRMFGELDHPADGRTSLQRASHIVTELRIDENGEVHGVIEPLPTPMGQVLLALAKAGCELGVSSRGRGSTRENDEGIEEVQDDYRLKTYDVVDNPASKNAFPGVFESDEARETFLESVHEEHRDEVRAVIETETARSKTFTIEDIEDEGLRNQLRAALGIEESETPAEAPAVETPAEPEAEKPAEECACDDAPKMGDDDDDHPLDKVPEDEKVGGLRGEGEEPKDAESGEDDGGAPAEESVDVQAVVAERDALALQVGKLKEQVANGLADLSINLREQVIEQVRTEMARDPEIAGARQVLEAVALQVAQFAKPDQAMLALKVENQALRDRLHAMEFDVARTKMESDEEKAKLDGARKSFMVEQMIGHHPRATEIRKFVDLNLSEDEIRAKVTDLFKMVGPPPDFHQRLKEAVQLGESMGAQYTKLQEEFDGLQEKAGKYEKTIARAALRIEILEAAVESPNPQAAVDLLEGVTDSQEIPKRLKGLSAKPSTAFMEGVRKRVDRSAGQNDPDGATVESKNSKGGSLPFITEDFDALSGSK